MRKNQHNEGYTLVELMVALLVALMLGGVLFSVYLVTTKAVEPWRRAITLEDHVHLIVQRLFVDLAYAEQLIPEEGEAWTLTYPSGRVVRYSYRDSSLTRNGRRMHEEALAVVVFRLVPSRLETAYALRRRDSALDDARSLVQVEIHLALRSRERTLTLTTTTALRRHRPWHPLVAGRGP
jgi:type II secretory pathway component PulJ